MSYHDDCGNYAQGLTPNPLPAVNLSHFSVLDHFFYRSQFGVRRESGYECYKAPEGVGRARQGNWFFQPCGAARNAVITGLMSAVTLRGQKATIPRPSTFVHIFFILFYMHSIQTLFGCGGHLTDIVYLHTLSSIMYSADGCVPPSTLHRIQYHSHSRSVVGASNS